MIYNRVALITALALVSPASMANKWRLAPGGNGFQEINVETVDIPVGAATGVAGTGEAQTAGTDIQKTADSLRAHGTVNQIRIEETKETLKSETEKAKAMPATNEEEKKKKEQRLADLREAEEELARVEEWNKRTAFDRANEVGANGKDVAAKATADEPAVSTAEKPKSAWDTFKETGKFTSNGKEFSVGGTTAEERASNAQAYSKLYHDNNGKLTAAQMQASGLMAEGASSYSGISKGENAGHTWTNASGETYTYQPASASGNIAAAPTADPVTTTATGVATNTPRTIELASPMKSSGEIVSLEQLQDASVDADYAGPTCGLVWDPEQGRWVSACSSH